MPSNLIYLVMNNFLQTTTPTLLAIVLVTLGLSSCDNPTSQEASEETPAALSADTDNGSIILPDGFAALLVADEVGKARHIVVRDNGDLYVKLKSTDNGGGILALRDTTGDGRADLKEYFTDYAGSGIDIYNDYLYFSTDTSVYRVKLNADELVPTDEPELVVGGFLSQPQHEAKSFTFDNDGHLYVTVGAPSNACQEKLRTPGSPGQDPCPQLELQGGIWQFSANQTNQTQEKDGTRYAIGIRNGFALDWNDSVDQLYALQHGRDQLATLWPEYYTNEQSAELPAEEFLRVDDGDDFGWPYCYYDPSQEKKLLAPEYGGNGQEIGRCEDKEQPIMAFPAHWAPNDLVFYQGDMFPDQYQQGAFIAFHGSWNRAPLPQQGYMVAFVPFGNDGLPSGEFERFADQFAGSGEEIETPNGAEYRPTGLAIGPDGSLYISDDTTGRIWRVFYEGSPVAME